MAIVDPAPYGADYPALAEADYPALAEADYPALAEADYPAPYRATNRNRTRIELEEGSSGKHDLSIGTYRRVHLWRPTNGKSERRRWP